MCIVWFVDYQISIDSRCFKLHISPRPFNKVQNNKLVKFNPLKTRPMYTWAGV